LATDFAFGLAFDPADRPAAPQAQREGPGRFRAVIGGVKDGVHFYTWKSADTFPSCRAARDAADHEFSK
jgi:hypothetical protein